MPDTVTLPGGLHVKKKVAIGLGIAGAAIAGYVLYRQHQQNAQATSASTTGSTSQNIDPQTGYAYGSPEDQAALAAMQGAGSGSLYGGGQGYYLGYGPPPTNNPPQTQGFTSNAEWTQAAEQLMGSTGNDAIAASLGKYLVGAPVTSDQVTIIQEAIASEGYPPVPGPNGFPPSYKTASDKPPPQHGTPAKNPVKGLKADARFTQVDVSWDSLTNAKTYIVEAHSAGSRPGSGIVAHDTTSGTKITLHNLKEKTRYRISVFAQPGTGPAAATTVTTH